MPLAPPSRPTATRGWCPGVLDPMETGDGWLLRVRRPGGVLSPGALRTIAGVASRFGSGAIDLTSRANLQIRGVAVDDLDLAAAGLIEGGVALGDPRLDAARSIVASPWAGHDPWAVVDATAVVADLEHRLVNGLVGALPSKFGVIVDDGGSWSLDELDADVRLIAGAGSAGVTWSLRLRGGPEPLGQVSDPAAAILAAAQLCADHGSRMDQVVERVGTAPVAAAVGARPPSTTRRSAARSPRPSPTPPGVGSYPHPDPARSNLVAAPFLGRIDAPTAERVASLTARFADDLRVTPRHSLAFCGVPGPLVHELAERARRPRAHVRSRGPQGEGLRLCGVPGLRIRPGRHPGRGGTAGRGAARREARPPLRMREGLRCTRRRPPPGRGRDRALHWGRLLDRRRSGHVQRARLRARRRRHLRRVVLDHPVRGRPVRRPRVAGARDRPDDPRVWRRRHRAARRRQPGPRPRGPSGARVGMHDLVRLGDGGPRHHTRRACPRTTLCAAAWAIPGSPRRPAPPVRPARRPRSIDGSPVWTAPSPSSGTPRTALFRLLELVLDGRATPAAIVGIPVGFVGAAESKEALVTMAHGVPYLTVRGRRGGSAMAAAAINTLASTKE